MRKLILGLLGVGLLAVGTPAMAQTADPLGLIASGAVIPYVGDGAIAPGSMSFLEVASPVGDNSGVLTGGIGGLHMFFFDASCVKGPQSVGIPLTTNDFLIRRVDSIDSNAVEGLLALGGVDNTGFFLNPMEAPIHARMLWFDAVTNTMRVLEPIGLAHFEDPCSVREVEDAVSELSCPLQVWNPLRTGATFVAPVEGLLNGLLNRTTIYLICPTPSVAGATGVFPSPPFPLLVPAAQSSTGLLARVYGDDEKFLRNATTTCSCLTATSVTKISDVYTSVAEAPFGTFTELEGSKTKTTAAVCDLGATGPGNAAGDCLINGTQFLIITPSTKTVVEVSFTGYRGIFSNEKFDTFGRLSNGSANSLQGAGTSAPTPLPFNPQGGR